MSRRIPRDAPAALGEGGRLGVVVGVAGKTTLWRRSSRLGGAGASGDRAEPRLASCPELPSRNSPAMPIWAARDGAIPSSRRLRSPDTAPDLTSLDGGTRSGRSSFTAFGDHVEPR